MKLFHCYRYYIFFIVICMAILISGCSGFNPEKIYASEKGVYVNPRLPAIDVEVDERSLETTYWTSALVSPAVKPESLKSYQGDLYDHYDDLKSFGLYHSKILDIDPIIQDDRILLKVFKKIVYPKPKPHKFRSKDGNFTYLYTHSNEKIQTSFLVDGNPVIETWVDLKPNSSNFEEILTFYKIYAEDSRNILSRELTRDLFQSENPEINGYAKCRILAWDDDFSLWLLPSVLTLFTLNLLGYPVASSSFSMTVEVELFDTEGESVACYIAAGKATTYGALYWGYNWAINPFKSNTLSEYAFMYRSISACQRAANGKALANAIKEIRRAIQRDSEMLRKKLTKSD